MTITIPGEVASNINRFTGRIWLLAPILDWLNEGNERVLVITGGPGSGKSSLAAWMVGHGPAPADEQAALKLGQLRTSIKAAHFVSPSSAPHDVVAGLARALAETVPGFAEALKKTVDRHDRIEVRQEVVNLSGTLTGVYINHLQLGDLTPERAFAQSLRDPLLALYAGGFSEQIVLLIDGLDAAESYSGQLRVAQLFANQASLLPPQVQVRFIVTTRPDPRVLKHYRDARSIDLIAKAPERVDDVHQYALRELARFGAHGVTLAGRVSEKAAGIFLYAYLVIEDLLARDQIPKSEEFELPERLSGLYHQFLTRELGADEERWYSRYRPILGLLAVAQGDGLTREQIGKILGRPADEIEPTLRACAQYLSGRLPEGPFRPFHQSFAEFLLDDEENQDYHIDGVAMHSLIGNYYLTTYADDWRQSDLYGLRHLPTHLLASRKSDRLEHLLTNLAFIGSKCSAGLVDELLRDFEALRMASSTRWDEEKPVAHFSHFVSHTAHLLRVSPALCYQEAYNSVQQDVRRAAIDLLDIAGFPTVPWLRKTAGTIRQQHSGQVISMAFWGEDRYLVVSTTELEVWVWDTALGELWRRCDTPASAAKSLVVSPNGEFLAGGLGAADPTPLISGVIIWTRDGKIYRDYKMEDWVYTLRWRNDSELVIGAGLPDGSEAEGTLWQASLTASTCAEIGRFLADRPIVLTWDPLPGQLDHIMALSMDGVVCYLTPEYVPFTDDELSAISMQLLSDGDYDAYDARLAERRPISHRLAAPSVDKFGFYTAAQTMGPNKICTLGQPPVPPEFFFFYTPNPDGIYFYDFEKESSFYLSFGEEARSAGLKGICLAATANEQCVAIGYSNGQVWTYSLKGDSVTPEKVHQGRFPVTAVSFSQSGRHVAVGDAGGQFAVYDRVERSLVFGTQLAEHPVAARVKDSQVLLLYSNRLELFSVNASQDTVVIPLVEDLWALDFDYYENLAVILSSSSPSEEKGSKQYVQIVDLAAGRVALCVDIPDRGSAMLKPNSISEDGLSAHSIRLHVDDRDCSLILGYAGGLVIHPLLAFKSGRTFVLPDSVVKRERHITVMRIGRNVPDISCEAIAIASEKNAVICGYADNADFPNISGEIRVWDLLTAEYSVSQHFSSSISSLESTSDGIVIVGTDHGEASSWQFDGEWHRLATIHHSVTVVAVACSEERQLACSASRDGVLKVWNYLRDTPLLTTFVDVEPIYVGFLDKDQSLCMVDRSGEVHVWHIEAYDEPPSNNFLRKKKESTESSSSIVQQCLDGAVYLSRVQELYNHGELSAAKLLLDALPDVPHAQEVQQYWQARLNGESP